MRQLWVKTHAATAEITAAVGALDALLADSCRGAPKHPTEVRYRSLRRPAPTRSPARRRRAARSARPPRASTPTRQVGRAHDQVARSARRARRAALRPDRSVALMTQSRDELLDEFSRRFDVYFTDIPDWVWTPTSDSAAR